MRKRATVIFITFLLGGFGAKSYYDTLPNVYNYTGENFTITDSTTFKTKDFIKHSTKTYRERNITVADTFSVYIHHLAVPASSSISGIMNYHVNSHGWPAIGYHSGIKENGDILLFNSLETISYHTRGQNTKGISIVLWGNYMDEYPKKEQIESLEIVLDALRQSVNIGEVSVHRRAPNARTSCPGDDAVKTLRYYGIIE